MKRNPHHIPAEKLEIYRDEHNNLCARIEGRGNWQKISVKRAFPYSEPENFIVLYSDEEEIGVIPNMNALDKRSHHVLEQALTERYHIPVIEEIIEIEEIHNATRWSVQTDRGVRDFEIQDRNNFRRIRGGGIIIVDVDANRFRIPDRNTLDPQSRKLLEMYF